VRTRHLHRPARCSRQRVVLALARPVRQRDRRPLAYAACDRALVLQRGEASVQCLGGASPVLRCHAFDRTPRRAQPQCSSTKRRLT
jgi:hypothetical protein